MTLKKVICDREILFDEEDLSIVEEHSWRRTSGENSNTFHRTTNISTNRNRKKYKWGSDRIYEYEHLSFYLHKEIAKASNSQNVLFKNNNRLDLRRCNLSIEIPVVSIYTGVYTCRTYNNYKKRWLSRIKDTKGKRINIGFYLTQNDAAQAYNEKALALYGKSAILNQIIDTPETTAKNPNWLKTSNGKYWKTLSKKEIIEIIKSNITESNKSDNEYIIKFIEGDENAFGFLVSKYNDFHLQTIKHENNKRKQLSGKFKNKISARNKGRNISFGETPLDYQDILIDGLMSIMKAVKTGRFQGINFKKWSGQVMRNKWNDYARRKYKLESWGTRMRSRNNRNFINRNKSKFVTIENSGY